MATIKFFNCQILRGGKLVNEELCIRNGKIVNPEPIFYEEQSKFDSFVDCKNCVIVPGFIELQINGKSILLMMKYY